QPSVPLRYLHSFPTRRSSDLLKYPSASFLTNLASPWNFIYSAAKLKADIHFYEKNIMGTGPFLYDGNTKGQDWRGKKNPDYFGRSEEHTSELQSRFDLVCRLL